MKKLILLNFLLCFSILGSEIFLLPDHYLDFQNAICEKIKNSTKKITLITSNLNSYMIYKSIENSLKVGVEFTIITNKVEDDIAKLSKFKNVTIRVLKNQIDQDILKINLFVFDSQIRCYSTIEFDQYSLKNHLAIAVCEQSIDNSLFIEELIKRSDIYL